MFSSDYCYCSMVLLLSIVIIVIVIIFCKNVFKLFFVPKPKEYIITVYLTILAFIHFFQVYKKVIVIILFYEIIMASLFNLKWLYYTQLSFFLFFLFVLGCCYFILFHF